MGVHQRFDAAAYRIASPYFAKNSFSSLRQIHHFEGINGPDGLKIKSRGKDEPGHLYNPQTGEGEIPELIETHYAQLVTALKEQDHVRIGFEAAWVAHYICDGLTPAHHFPLNERLAEQPPAKETKKPRYQHRVSLSGPTPGAMMKRNWAIWGGKGLLTTHFNFEMGVATAVLGHRIRVKLDHAKLAQARSLGPVPFFEEEARSVAGLQLYEDFYRHGWNARIARKVRNQLAPQIVQCIAITWLLASLEADMAAVT